MPFNSHTASLAGKKSKRGKSKLTPDIQDRLGLLAAENQYYLLSHLDELNNTERIKLTQLLLTRALFPLTLPLTLLFKAIPLL